MQRRRKTEYIIVHHSATPRDKTTFEAIKKWHTVHNGWDSVGYHRVIEGDGSVHKGMPENMVGYHCRHGGFNFKSVAVCLTGNFCTGQETPSKAQLESLEKTLKEWQEKYNIPKERILGHRETGASTACPGIGLIEWLRNYRRRDSDAGDEIFKNCFITQAQRWPTKEEVEKWHKSGLPPYTWVQQNAPNPLKEELDSCREEKDKKIEVYKKEITELEKEAQELISEKRKCSRTINSLSQEKISLSEQLRKTVEASKRLEARWEKEKEDLVKKLESQEKAIKAGIEDSCKIAYRFQTRWQSASGISWILEGLSRLLRGR